MKSYKTFVNELKTDVSIIEKIEKSKIGDVIEFKINDEKYKFENLDNPTYFRISTYSKDDEGQYGWFESYGSSHIEDVIHQLYHIYEK